MPFAIPHRRISAQHDGTTGVTIMWNHFHLGLGHDVPNCQDLSIEQAQGLLSQIQIALALAREYETKLKRPIIAQLLDDDEEEQD